MLALRGGGGGGGCFERGGLVSPTSCEVDIASCLDRIGNCLMFPDVLISLELEESSRSGEISGFIEERRGGSGGTGLRLTVSWNEG